MEQRSNGIMAPSTKREAFDDWQDPKLRGLTKQKTFNALFESGQNPITQDIDAFWKAKKKSDRDVISFLEFEELYSDLGDPKKTLREALIHFDQNRNGKIDRSELTEILKAAGELEHTDKQAKDNYVDMILGLGDRNKDHELDIDELVTMIQDGLIRR